MENVRVFLKLPIINLKSGGVLEFSKNLSISPKDDVFSKQDLIWYFCPNLTGYVKDLILDCLIVM